MTYTLPQGEQMVSLTVHNGDLFAASTTRLWLLHPEHGLLPVEIVTDPGADVDATVVIAGGGDQS